MKSKSIFPRLLLIINLVGFLCASTGNVSAQNHSILFRSGNYVPEAGTDKFINNKQAFQSCLYDGNYYALMQFNILPSKAEKLSLKNAGIILGDFIPNNAFYAQVPAGINGEIFKKMKIRSIVPVPVNSKIEPMLLGNNIPAHVEKSPGILDIKVKYHGTIGYAAAETAIRASGADVLSHSTTSSTIDVRIKKEALEALAALPWIQWILPVAPDKSANNSYGRPLHRDNVLQSTLSGQRGLTGKGVRVGLFDVANADMHIDFSSRLNQEYAGPFADHSTHCAGTIAGAGLMDPNGKGMAPASTLYSWSFNGDVLDSTWTYIPIFNYKITSNSWGYGGGYHGDYDYNSWFADTIAWVHRNVSQIFAAANDGSGYNTISSGSNSAKNTITVGALDRDTIAYFSSRGPVNDGRLKPEVCALGVNVYSTLPYNTYDKYSGTSMATPGTAGTVALLYERYRQLNSGQDPQNDLIKAVLMNTAYDLGNPGPDFIYGYGRIDGLAAVRTLEAKNYLLDSIGNADTFKLPFTITSPLIHPKVMLNWTDVPSTVVSSRMLINDLDLKIITPAGDTLLPWVLNPLNQSANAVHGIDSINVEEQITADTFQSGSYLLLVIGKNVPVGPQNFALTYLRDTTNLELTSPLGGESYSPVRQTMTASGYQYNDTNQVGISWESSPVTSPFNIYFSADKGTSWTFIGSAPSYRRNFFWRVPDTSSSQCLIRITNGAMASMSDSTFTILRAPQIIYTMSCQSSALGVWNKTPGAVSYDVMRLYKDSIWTVLKNTTDTFFIDSSVSAYSAYWYSVRSVDKNAGLSQQAIAVHLYTYGSSCPATLDAGISSIDSPAQGFCTGAVNIYASLTNYGLSSLTSATISWSVNGVSQTPYKWTGSLGTGASSSIKIGSYSMVNGNSYDIKAYSTKPNGSTDGNTVNDTGFRYNIQGGLSGTYSIGIISPIYPTISSGIDDLNARGVCGAVTMQILDGNYTEQSILYSVRGASAKNTITFESQSGDSSLVNWNYPNNAGYNFVFMLYGASYVNLHNLTLQRTGTGILSSARVLNISGNSHHINFNNNQLIGVYGASTLAYLTEGVDSAINFSNNYLKYGNYGVYLYSYYGYDATSNKIKGNIIDSSYIDAMFIGYQSGLQIVGNTITNTGAGDNSNSIYGISLTGCDDAYNIERNRIDMQNLLAQAYGISLNASFASSSAPGMMTNNFVSMGCKDTTQSPYGINLYYTTYQNVYFNNVHIYNTNPQGIAFLSYYNYGYGNNVENNNFVNHGGSYAMYIAPSAYFDSVNYNNLYSSGSVTADWNGTDYSGISSYVSGTSQNNTIGIDPLYTSNSDLHVNAKGLSKSGKAITGIALDIDGLTRHSIPTIGAAELIYTDAGTISLNSGVTSYCESTQKVNAEIKNYGIETITSATVNWSVNGKLQKSVKWTGAMNTGDSSSVALGSLTLAGGTNYDIKVWTSSPNKGNDADHSNDTFSVTLKGLSNPSATVGKSSSICKGDSVQIGGTSTSGNTYAWTSNPSGYSSSTSNPYVMPASSTTYRLTETITLTGCSKTDSVTIKVNSLPAVSAGKGSTVCSGSSVFIGNAPFPTHKYSWTSKPSGFTSSSSGPTVKPTDTTTYYVTETDGNGCHASDSVTINVNPLPIVSVGKSQSICQGDSVSIGAASASGYSYNWSSSPSGYSSVNSINKIAPSTTTKYYLTDTITATGCFNSDSVTITVNKKPTPSLGKTTDVCAGSSMIYSTTNNSGSSYFWSSYGGSISSGSGTNSVNINWGTAGSAYVKLTEMNAAGCIDSTMASFTIRANPVAKYSGAKACNGIATSFIDSSGNHKFQLWYFGDGDTSTTAIPSHVYKNAGTYSSYLVVMDSFGCYDSAKAVITVDATPNAHWTVINNIPSFTYLADDTSMGASAYSWTFGDGANAGNFKTTHTYVRDSVYGVRLTVNAANGCVNHFDSSITVLRTAVINENIDDNKISLYPNPFRDLLTLDYTLAHDARIKISLYSVDGKLLATPLEHMQASGKYTLQIDPENYSMSPGVYFLRMTIGEKEIITKQIIKVK